jgi:glutamyl-tRNA synthetase
MQPGRLAWSDQLMAGAALDAQVEVGDVVLRRSDGFLAYHLATAVDELSLGMADVARGADLWRATGAQLAVMQWLGGEPPRFWHLPLWSDAQGQRLAKRQGAVGVERLRAEGHDAASAIGYLAASVQLVPAGSRLSSDELLQQLSLDQLRVALLQAGVGDPACPGTA